MHLTVKKTLVRITISAALVATALGGARAAAASIRPQDRARQVVNCNLGQKTNASAIVSGGGTLTFSYYRADGQIIDHPVATTSGESVYGDVYTPPVTTYVTEVQFLYPNRIVSSGADCEVHS